MNAEKNFHTRWKEYHDQRVTKFATDHKLLVAIIFLLGVALGSTIWLVVMPSSHEGQLISLFGLLWPHLIVAFFAYFANMVFRNLTRLRFVINWLFAGEMVVILLLTAITILTWRDLMWTAVILVAFGAVGLLVFRWNRGEASNSPARWE